MTWSSTATRGVTGPRRPLRGLGGFGSLAFSIPLGFSCGRPFSPFSRTICARWAATVCSSAATLPSNWTTSAFSSVGQSASRSPGRAIFPGNQRPVRRGSENRIAATRFATVTGQRSSPMPTQCHPDALLFASVEGRSVVASFTGGAITSDAGALLLGATDRAIPLLGRFASCFTDARDPERVEHEVATLIGQRVFGIALGYEDLIDHDQIRHDPVLAVLAGKLAARRSDCAPLAGKSTLNRLEHAPSGGPGRYHKIGHDPAAVERLFVDLFMEAHARAP